MEFKFIYLDKIHVVELKKEKDSYVAIVDKKEFKINGYTSTGGGIALHMKDRQTFCYIATDQELIYLNINGENYTFEPVAGQVHRSRADLVAKGNSVASPMPGLLVKVPVKVGDFVQVNTILAIVEAMKMQNELRSPCNGLVKKINFNEGEQVDALKPIVELDPSAK